MAGQRLALGDADSLAYHYVAPGARSRTFVFVNALTGSAALWEAAIAPSLRSAGYGTLTWDMRGQGDSTFAPGLALDQPLIVGDLVRLLATVRAPRPVLVGLSIGGLFAAGAVLAGADAAALVLINTLRCARPRLEWIGTAMAKAARLGGTRLVMDMYMPLLVNEERLAAVRADWLTDAPYEGLPPEHGHASLLANAVAADWDVAWERIRVPTLVMSGLQDRVFYDAGDVRALTARLPHARALDIADAGHLIPVERPEATVAALLDFAAGL